MPILPTSELISTVNDATIRWVVAQIDVAAESIVQRASGALSPAEQADFDEMKATLLQNNYEPCYIIFSRPEARTTSLITVLSDKADIKLKMLYSSSTFGLRRALGRNSFDKGLHVQKAVDLDYAAYAEARDAYQEKDARLLSEAEVINKATITQMAHGDLDEASTAAAAAGGVVATAGLGFAWDNDLLEALRTRENDAVVFTVKNERFVLIDRCAAEAAAAAAVNAGAAFVVCPNTEGKTYFAYYMTQSVPLKTRMTMSGAKSTAAAKLRDEFQLSLTSFEASEPEELAERLAETENAPRATMDAGDIRARPRPMRRR